MFLDRVTAFSNQLPQESVREMGAAYAFFSSKNVEVVARYFGIGLRARDEEVYAPTAELLARVGRMKFVRPL